MKIFLILVIVISTVFLVMILIGWLFSAPAYRGPVSDHFDGKRFHNPGNVQAKGFDDLIRWMRTRDQGPWHEITEKEPTLPPVEKVEGDSIAVTFVNHSTFLIQTQGFNILTDPVWSERASPVSFAGPKRMRQPGIKFEDLPGIDFVLLTHNHYDHLDIKTMQRLSREHGVKVFCPLGVGRYLERKGIGNVTEMDWWDETSISEHLQLICTPAQHFSGRGMFDRDRTLWSGFALKTSSGSIYYSGDTGYGEFFSEIAARIAPIRLSFLPIGAYKPEWFMSPIHTSPAEALKIHQEIQSPLSIAMHFGTFPLADDGMGEAESELSKALGLVSEMNGSFKVLDFGKTLIVK
jgi:L-ascorbate metabolism protein UlaG (beta-lactamase superfamily)